jgi:hypothetical protein
MKTDAKDVSLRDPHLNQKLPSYSITRGWERDQETNQLFGKNGNDELISQNYWENSLKVQSFLQRLNDNQVFDSCIDDSEQFKKLLLKLHQIQTLGILRDTPYAGQTIHSQGVLTEDWQNHFRGSEFRIKATATPNLTKDLLENARAYDYEYFFDEQNTLKNRATIEANYQNKEYQVGVDVYLPENILLGRPLSDDVISRSLDEVFSSPTLVVKDRESLLVYFINYDFVRKNFNKYDPDAIAATFLYPSARYINDYLDLMRTNIASFRQESDFDKKVQLLANAYQSGIRSQAFETVWNSEMMGVVNYLLIEDLKLDPIPHGHLDFYAFLLSKVGFERYFAHFLRFFVDKAKKE